MSVPYDSTTAAHGQVEAAVPPTPEEQLAQLLARSLNSFELPEETIRSLDGALAHDGALHSAHHCGGMHRETYRHTWLLADGRALTLWELVYNTTPVFGVLKVGGEDAQHELYTEEDELRTALSRLLPSAGAPHFGLPEAAEDDLWAAPESLALMPDPRTEFVPDNSPDHARRVLRRAENADRPGCETARLLTSAHAHRITQAFGLSAAETVAGCGFALYEHAFLLGDGSEVSLWEVEHTATPDRRHMCEVYLTQDMARRAMEHRASRALP